MVKQHSNNGDLHFQPHPLVRNPHIQTVLASRVVKPTSAMLNVSQEIILEIPVDEGVYLQGFYSPQPEFSSKGLILLLHGWLGCAESAYILSIGDFLYAQGYAIFRLNMRDHGGTAHLNEGFFHGARLPELFGATQQIAALEKDTPFFMAGFSMGGNFALRLAWCASHEPIPNLKHIISVSPSVNPEEAILGIDRSLYKNYFLRKWKNHMREKQAAFPKAYYLDDLLEARNSIEVSEKAIPRYTGYTTSKAYYDVYRVSLKQAEEIALPTTIIAAEDDPIIYSTALAPYKGINPCLTVSLQPHGGHVGFIDIFPFRRWLAEAIFARFEAYAKT